MWNLQKVQLLNAIAAAAVNAIQIVGKTVPFLSEFNLRDIIFIPSLKSHQYQPYTWSKSLCP